MQAQDIPKGDDAIETLLAGKQAVDDADVDATLVKLVVFTLTGKRFAVPLDDIHVILPEPEVANVPGTPSWVLGVANHRGELLPVIDLAELLGLQRATVAKDPYLLVACVEGVPTGVGCRIDQLEDITSVPGSAIQPPLSTVTGGKRSYFEGEIAHEGEIIVVLRLRGLNGGGADG